LTLKGSEKNTKKEGMINVKKYLGKLGEISDNSFQIMNYLKRRGQYFVEDF
jgi:hypothetical protein